MPSQPIAPRRVVGLFVARPALPAVLVFILGIVLHAKLPIAPLMWAGAIVACVIAAVITFQWDHASSIFVALAMFLSGIAIAQVVAFYYPRDHIAAFATDQTRLAQLELQIDHEPRILADPFSAHPMPPKQIVTAEVKRVKTWNGWVDSCGQILVQISQPHPRLAINQRVRVLGTLERPGPAMNPGQFDWAKYYREQRVLTSIHITLAQNIQIISTSRAGPLDYIRAQSRRLLALGFTQNQSLDFALLRALLLGDNDPELRDVQEQFRRTGTSHQLSVSGMHVAVLSGFVFIICCMLRMRPRPAVLLTMAFAILYAIAALPAPPIARSILLCIFISVGIAGRRSIDRIQLLSLSVLAMLIYNPLDLFNAGFQLSAGTVLGLMIFSGPLMRWFRSLRQQDPVPPEQIGIPKRAAAACESWLTDSFAVGVVAWIISMPLVAFHFAQLNIWAIPASIILGPVVFFALIGGLLKVLLTLLFPGFAHAWALLAAQPIIWMRHIVDWLARLPGNAFPFPGMSVAMLLIVYALFLLWLVPTKQTKLKILLRISPFAACGLAILLPLSTIRAIIPRDEMTLTLLSLGAGQCAVLETPAGRTVMIDAGSSTLSDVLRKCVAPYLRTRACTQIDTMILTHPDYDHVSAAGSVAGVYDVREVLVGSRFRALAQGNPPAEALLRTLDSLDLPPRVVTPGQRIPLGRGVEIEVLWPPVSGLSDLSSNDSAVVARIHYGGRSILITGDIQEEAERALVKHPELLKSDVLIAPHHGSSESTTPAFIKAVDPAIILSSNDRTLTGKQRRFEPMAAGRAFYRTHTCGAITLRIGANGDMKVETFLPGRHN